MDLEDCLVKIQRPQFSEYHNYIFFILTFPFYNNQTREIVSSEVDFFIGSKYLITINDGLNDTVNDFFKEIKNNDYNKKQHMSSHPVNLLYAVLQRLQSHTFPMLDHVSEDIESIEKRIFKGEEKRVVKEILHIKRNIVNLRKIMQAHKNIIKKLMNTHTKFFMPNQINIYFTKLFEVSIFFQNLS